MISEETRKRMSEAQKKRFSKTVIWNKGKSGLQVAWNKGKIGKKHSEETKLKMSIKKIGKKPYEMTDKIKKNLSNAHLGQIPWNKGLKMIDINPNYKNPKGMLGKQVTEEARKKISEKLKGTKRKPFSEEHRKKISIAKKGIKLSPEHIKKLSGDNCNFWKGGISNSPYSNDWTDVLRDSVRQRDNFTCQECGIHQDELKNRHKKLDVHHIDYDKNNCNLDNLISLCRNCHIKTNFDRDYWIKYFKNV